MIKFNVIIYITVISLTNTIAQEKTLTERQSKYLDEYQRVYSLLSECIFYQDDCVEFISQDKRYENLNHRLYSSI